MTRTLLEYVTKRYSVPQSIAEERSNERLAFYPYKISRPYRLSAAPKKYVCWIDVMGSQEIMLQSLAVASNFLMKLHIAALRVSEEFPLQLFPVIDGIYVCSSSQSRILTFINRIHSMLAVTFILEKNEHFRFKVRSGLAYGPVVEGNKLLRCSDELGKHPLHTDAVLLGSALTHAYQAEKEAAPFGVALHKSVTAVADEIPFSGNDLKWWKFCSRSNDNLLARELYLSLRDHYSWCLTKSAKLGYNNQAINRHKAKIDEYFEEFVPLRQNKPRYVSRY
jgi:hypothetical protein